MKRFRNLLAILIATASVAVLAAETPVQKTETAALGAATYTQSDDYVVFQVNRIEVFGTQPTSATATVRRVSGGLTNTISTIVVTSGYGGASNLTEYLFRDDSLVVTAAGTNTATIRITGVQQP